MVCDIWYDIICSSHAPLLCGGSLGILGWSHDIWYFPNPETGADVYILISTVPGESLVLLGAGHLQVGVAYIYTGPAFEGLNFPHLWIG